MTLTLIEILNLTRKRNSNKGNIEMSGITYHNVKDQNFS